jgi:Flp pilus assembly protein protease CpaA
MHIPALHILVILALSILMGKVCFLASKSILINKMRISRKEVFSVNWRDILITSILFFTYATVYVQSKDVFEMCLLTILATCLAVLIITDIWKYIIPDIIQFIMALNGIIYAYYSNQYLIKILLLPLFCYLLVFGVAKLYSLFAERSVLGMGDMKFFAVSAVYLPIENIANFFFLSGILGVIVAIVWRMLAFGRVFPFGPALAVALFFSLLFPEIEFVNRIINP